jgi:hypothetical protein
MDTLFWKQLHPDIAVKESKQLLYGKYPYRLVLFCNGGSMLRYPDTPFNEQMSWKRNINYGGSWRGNNKTPSAKELKFLETLLSIRGRINEQTEQGNESVRMRIEDPYIQFYSTDEKLLQHLAIEMFTDHSPLDFLNSITVPYDQESLDLITNGYVLKNSQHACKIHIRDGRYSYQSRTALLNYLDSLGDVVTIPLNTKKILGRDKSDYIWGAYFYSNDEKIHMMINLIDPRFIRTVERYHSQAK